MFWNVEKSVNIMGAVSVILPQSIRTNGSKS